MYIDTYSEISMKQSIFKYLGISQQDLSELFESVSAKISSGRNRDLVNQIIGEFIDLHMPNNQIDEILFFHLSNRLNSSNNSLCGNNLFDLLTTENALSNFLMKHKVYLSPNVGYLDLYYNGKLKSLEDRSKQSVPYLRRRLGYNTGREDFCFNGFAFKDLLYRNSYARNLFAAPEFIGVLSKFLNNSNIKKDYRLNSEFYCFEYLAPIDEVLFDKDDQMSLECKKMYLINQVINRLYDYSVTNIKYMEDQDNPILRLSDYDTMQEKYFVTKEEITWGMLCC